VAGQDQRTLGLGQQGGGARQLPAVGPRAHLIAAIGRGT